MRSVLPASDLADLEHRIAALTPVAKPVWGRMSVAGMVCHLTDSFHAVLGERPATYPSTALERSLIRLLALSTPLPWPKGVATVAEVDQERGGTPPEDFAADVDRLRAALHLFLRRLPHESLSHPIFGTLTRSEWGRWGYRHVDHHLRQFGL
jgi:hypothetical protein